MKNEILFVTTYRPRVCGIATFSYDLISALKNQFSESFDLSICALGDSNSYQYANDVKYVANMDGHISSTSIAHQINANPDISLVCIQHEFGLFGGRNGRDILPFLHEIKKPIVVVFHTVLPQPDKQRKDLIKAISLYVDKIIVMTHQSRKILQDNYEVATDKVKVIPHGTHLAPNQSAKSLKIKYGLEKRKVLSTFGLISSNKSIETSIEALPKIIEKTPDIILLVLGETHPEVLKWEGEAYREFLQRKVQKLSLHNHVKFVNKYLELNELLEYLTLTDIYLFTSKDQFQAVSGTFAYAMSCGCPIISTPIPHALELLSKEAGVFFDFQDSNQLANATNRLLQNKRLRQEMRINALHIMQPTIWPNVAIAYANLFADICHQDIKLQFSLPKIDLTHLKRMTTKTGMIQFSNINEPDITSGYTLDDNSRALIATVHHYILTKDPKSLMLINTYLNFIVCCQGTGGRFLNYVDRTGKFHSQNDDVNLDDSNGRAIWALGTILSQHHHFPKSMILKAKISVDNASKWILRIESPRAIGFVIKGLYHAYSYCKSAKLSYLIGTLSEFLQHLYFITSSDDWHWFEDYLTYSNSILPEAMLYAYATSNNPLYLNTAINSMNFLLSHTFTEHGFKAISNNGWLHKEQVKCNKHGEQPIEVSYTIQALDTFQTILKTDRYSQHIRAIFDWFLGSNSLQQTVYNPSNGGCYDGLEKNNPNLNQGAESTVCYLIARLLLEKYQVKKPHQKQSLEKVMTTALRRMH